MTEGKGYVEMEEERTQDSLPESEVLYSEEPEVRLYQEEHPPIKVKKKGIGKRVISVVLIVLLSAGAGFGGGMAALYYGQGIFAPKSTVGDITIDPSEDVNTAEAVAAKVIPSVVGISTKTEVLRQNIFGMESGQVVEGVGTGFIIDENGYIVTNSHVVGDGSAETITVQLTDGRELQGTVLWNDATLDLAVVKIDASGLVPVELGDSSTVNIGSYAVAIGNPLGMAFDRSVTQGVISGLNRTITVGSGTDSTTMEGLMQTDASINSGNSGGPLLDKEGQVIGINTAKAASGEGLGFAIPINTVKPVIEEVMKTGTFQKAYMGIGGADMALYLQYYPDQDLGTDTGVYVIQVYPGSPANVAGLKEGDVIVKLEDTEMKTMEQLTRELFSYKPGDQVAISLYREGKLEKLNLTLGTNPETNQE